MQIIQVSLNKQYPANNISHKGLLVKHTLNKALKACEVEKPNQEVVKWLKERTIECAYMGRKYVRASFIPWFGEIIAYNKIAQNPEVYNTLYDIHNSMWYIGAGLSLLYLGKSCINMIAAKKTDAELKENKTKKPPKS